MVADPFGTLTPCSESPLYILLPTLHYFTLPYLVWLPSRLPYLASSSLTSPSRYPPVAYLTISPSSRTVTRFPRPWLILGFICYLLSLQQTAFSPRGQPLLKSGARLPWKALRFYEISWNTMKSYQIQLNSFAIPWNCLQFFWSAVKSLQILWNPELFKLLSNSLKYVHIPWNHEKDLKSYAISWKSLKSLSRGV